MNNRNQVSAIVIGSGFGGAVAALRLGEAGVRTIVLERGRRWPITQSEDTFAPSTHPDGRAVWFRTSWNGHAVDRYAGVRDIVETANMTITQGAGVGGGSLVYAAVSYQPSRDMFARAFGNAIDYAEMDRVFYPRVRERLGASPIPDDVLAADCSAGARRFAAHAQAAGLHARRLDLAVDWDVVRQEIAGARKPSLIAGEFTTNSGAKNTLDRNYLAAAEATGNVEIRPLHRAVSIAARPGGGFGVSVEVIDEQGAVIAREELACQKLFLAAGSLGTTALLLRARAHGALPRLSDRVGHAWGTNGDRFVPITEEPRMVSGLAIEDFHNPHGPVVIEDGSNVRLAMTFGATGTWRYDAARDEMTLVWPASEAAEAGATRATLHCNRVLETRNGLPQSSECIANRTVHPLGGAVIGSVCDTFGRVLGHDGLFVVDGALLPGTAACTNPSLTIAALAERAMHAILC